MSNTRIEFAVQMTCENCEKAVRKSLEGVEGVKSVEINRSANSVVVNTNLSTENVQKHLETTGKKVIVKGLGRKAGVAILEFGCDKIKGVVRFVQDETDKKCVIDGTIDGLKPNLKHFLSVHECGDTSNGCESVGEYYQPHRKSLGVKILGELGEISPQDNGRSEFRLENDFLDLSDIIGRALVVSERNKNQNKRLACGIIARSAGLFQNPKTICACDGISIWDEKQPPNAQKV